MAAMKHIVLFKFRPDVSEEKIEGLFRDLKGLKEKIPGISDFTWGPYSGDEGMNQGYGHGFIMTFTDTAARDAYLPHPEHEVVKNSILRLVDGVIAFDFEA